MAKFSSGKYAQFISDRSGMAFPYQEMVVEWTGARVHTSEFEPKSPQVSPKPETIQGTNLFGTSPTLS